MNRSGQWELEARSLGLPWCLSEEKSSCNVGDTGDVHWTSSVPWTVEPGGLQPMGSQRDRQDWATKHEGNSNPTQSASHPEDRELISECGSVYHFPHRESLSVNSVSWTALGHHWFTFWCKLLISSWSWFCRMGSRSLTQTLALKMLHEHPGPAPAHCSVLWAVLHVMCGGC